MSASPKRELTPDELLAANILKHCSAPAASWDKRAIATIRFAVTPPTPPTCTCNDEDDMHGAGGHFKGCPAVAPPWKPMLGEKMIPQLWRLLYRYRRQWTGLTREEKMRLMRMVEERMAPDYRKQQAALRKQAELDALKAKLVEAKKDVMEAEAALDKPQGKTLCEVFRQEAEQKQP